MVKTMLEIMSIPNLANKDKLKKAESVLKVLIENWDPSKLDFEDLQSYVWKLQKNLTVYNKIKFPEHKEIDQYGYPVKD